MKLTSLGAVLLMLVGCALCGVTVTEEKTGPPYQANGVKIGEVTQTSAIIWTRLTEKPERNTDGIPFAKTKKLKNEKGELLPPCLLYTSPSPRDRTRSRMPSSA